MPKIVSELIVSLDQMARGTQAPGYFGFMGPEFGEVLKARNSEPHRTLMGRKTYELLNGLPENARDEGWQRMTEHPGFLYSRNLERVEWPGLELVREEMTGHVRGLKEDDGPELRVLGSLSIARQIADANLLDGMRLYVCPVALPATGIEPVFAGWGDTRFALTGCETLDGRVVMLDYRLEGTPPSTEK